MTCSLILKQILVIFIFLCKKHFLRTVTVLTVWFNSHALKILFECHVNESKTLVLFCLFFRFYFLSLLFVFYKSSFATELYGSCRHHLTCGIQWKKQLGHSVLVDFNYNFSPNMWLSYKYYCNNVWDSFNFQYLASHRSYLCYSQPVSIFQTSNFLIFVLFLWLRLPTSLRH